jgi:hypothetical protein
MLFIILAIVAVLALGVGVYFMFFSGKSQVPTDEGTGGDEVSDGGSSDGGSSDGGSSDGGSSDGGSSDDDEGTDGDDEYTALSLGE